VRFLVNAQAIKDTSPWKTGWQSLAEMGIGNKDELVLIE